MSCIPGERHNPGRANGLNPYMLPMLREYLWNLECRFNSGRFEDRGLGPEIAALKERLGIAVALPAPAVEREKVASAP
jgi:hypothetical protein